MLGLAIAVLFITLNGFFVAAEFALVKVRRGATQFICASAGRSAPSASAVISRLDRHLLVTQFGITSMSPASGDRGAGRGHPRRGRPSGGRPAAPRPTSADRRRRSTADARLPSPTSSMQACSQGFVAAIQRMEKTALVANPPASPTSPSPLLWILEKATAVILRAAGLKADVASEASRTRFCAVAGRLSAVRRARQRGALERVLRFSQRTARLRDDVLRVDVERIA